MADLETKVVLGYDDSAVTAGVGKTIRTLNGLKKDIRTTEVAFNAIDKARERLASRPPAVAQQLQSSARSLSPFAPGAGVTLGGYSSGISPMKALTQGGFNPAMFGALNKGAVGGAPSSPGGLESAMGLIKGAGVAFAVAKVFQFSEAINQSRTELAKLQQQSANFWSDIGNAVSSGGGAQMLSVVAKTGDKLRELNQELQMMDMKSYFGQLGNFLVEAVGGEGDTSKRGLIKTQQFMGAAAQAVALDRYNDLANETSRIEQMRADGMANQVEKAELGIKLAEQRLALQHALNKSSFTKEERDAMLAEEDKRAAITLRALESKHAKKAMPVVSAMIAAKIGPGSEPFDEAGFAEFQDALKKPAALVPDFTDEMAAESRIKEELAADRALQFTEEQAAQSAAVANLRGGGLRFGMIRTPDGSVTPLLSHAERRNIRNMLAADPAGRAERLMKAGFSATEVSAGDAKRAKAFAKEQERRRLGQGSDNALLGGIVRNTGAMVDNFNETFGTKASKDGGNQ